jgi:hypothetical protein
MKGCKRLNSFSMPIQGSSSTFTFLSFPVLYIMHYPTEGKDFTNAFQTMEPFEYLRMSLKQFSIEKF